MLLGFSNLLCRRHPLGLAAPSGYPSVDPSTLGGKTLYKLASLKYCYIIQERLMCFGCHFNICARHARSDDAGANAGAGGKDTSLAIVTETSIWATRVLGASGGSEWTS